MKPDKGGAEQWSGPAERDASNAVIDLLVERQVVSDATTIGMWLLSHASTPSGLREPDIYAPCLCGSVKRLKFCHRDELQLINRLALFPADCQLTDVLGIKERDA